MRNIATMTREEILEEIRIAEELKRRTRERKILSYFPDTGPLRRELYAKHLEFFRAGSSYRERLMLAANRIGKTESVGGYELSLHLTGWYPAWWEGRRFERPIRAWASGDTGLTVRDIIQFKLLGPTTALGTGLIPAECIERAPRAPGRADSIDTIYVRHKSGGISECGLKSYEQGSISFQGTEKDVIWLDEEPPLDVYTECLLRTMTNDGMIMCTFTPLLGMSDVVLQFMPGGQLTERAPNATKYTVMATWDDAPHLNEQAKKDLWASIPPFQRDARSKGIPQLGAGAIYPVPESEFTFDPFPIPDWWPRGYGMDVGWNCTAGIWGAYEREIDCLWLYHAAKGGHDEPAVHVAKFKAAGDWIPGFIDPASRGRGQTDGRQLLADYRDLGLHLSVADNGVESGLYAVWNRLSTGRLKVAKSLSAWFAEFRLYRRDDKGRVVKENDHLMDACLVGETIVHTEHGQSRIDELVGNEGTVISRDGSLARFIGSRKTINNAPCITLRFSDNSEVTCTEDHPFLTQDGWKKASEMYGQSCYNGVSQRIHWRQAWSKLFHPRSKSSKVSGTTSAENTSSGMAVGSMFGYGKDSIGSGFPVGSLFTTMAMTGRTTNQQTLSYYLDPNTQATISWVMDAESRKQPQKPQKSGIALRPVNDGIESTIRNIQLDCINLAISPVFNAEMISEPKSPAKTNSVQTTASHSIAARAVLITRNVFAWLVARISWSVSTVRNPAAIDSALVSCVGVSNAGSHDVYCLTVPGTSAFCVGSGLVVHNTRYLESRISQMIVKPLPARAEQYIPRQPATQWS